MKTGPFRYFASALILLAAACQSAPDPAIEVDADTEVTAPASVNWTRGAMVAAADPRAVEAGLEVLRAGGNAIDAAIAVHTVLGLVEPQSSGIGGGAFMLYYDAETDAITVYDGRETAPMAADETLFLDENGEALDYVSAWQSGRSVGVPSVVALYARAHADHGDTDWARLFESAIALASDGFEVSPRLAGFVGSSRMRSLARLDDHPVSAAYFYPGGEPLEVGDVRTNPDYAETLRAIATEGAPGFYNEAVASAIVATIAEDPLPGAMTVEDILSYEVKVRDPLCGEWRTMVICSAPPPSSGGVVQNMIPALYDRLVPDEATSDVQLKAFVDAQRLTYADRDHYVADADFVTVPASDLIDPRYLDHRATEAFAPAGKAVAGDPGEVLRGEPIIDIWGRDTTEDAPGTTHISIVDGEGNAVSMTATVESVFGNSRMVNGFLLNNELTDFARTPRINGKLVANAPAPGKRPRSSMSPTIILDADGELRMVTGSPGGNSIVAYVAKTIVGVFDWGLSPQEAIDFPNIIARGDVVGVEVDRPGGPEAADALSAMGYTVQEREGENSGLHVILVEEDGLVGGADPRREGVALAPD